MTPAPKPRSTTVTIAAVAGLTLIAPGAWAAASCGAPAGYPSFCAIPQIPKDIPTAEAYKTAVVDTRLSGRSLEQNTDPSRFSLSGTEDFAEDARARAIPPPSVDGPAAMDTEAFLRDARARVTPPPRPR